MMVIVFSDQSCTWREPASASVSMASSLTDVVPIWLPVLLLASLFLLFKIMKIIKNQNEFLLPPGPPKLPLIGNLHQLGDLAHASLWKLSEKYGPVMHLRLGSVPTLVVSSAEAARDVLRTHDLDCCSRPSFAGTRRLTYNHLDIAFAPYGDYWREERKLCVASLLSAKRVESFGSIREEEVYSTIDSINQSQLTSPSSEVNISQKMMTLSANMVCKIAFGDSFLQSEIEHTRFEELMHEAFSLLQSFCASDFFPRVGWIADRLTGFHNKLERSFHEFDVFYQRVIDQHKDRKRTEDEEDMVDMLLRIMREQQTDVTFRLTEDHIKSIIMNVLVGGVDSSAITTTWAMAELSRNTRVMRKVQDEIRTHIGNKGRVSESDLEQFQYFKMVVKETLRLHPPGVLLIPRETMSHFKINGYDICPKTFVMVNAWAIGRDGNTWEKPEEFNPERFEDSPIDYKGQHFELLPFGAGRRICPGISLGTTMVELALANLLYSYDWKLPSGMKEEEMDMEEAPGIAVRKKLPLKLVPLIYNWHKA